MSRFLIIAIIFASTALNIAPAHAIGRRAPRPPKPLTCYPSGMCSGDPERASLPVELANTPQRPTFDPPHGGAPTDTANGSTRLYGA